MASTKRIRVYLCSDFGDLREERAYLHDRVLPRLREACAGRGEDVEFVDHNLNGSREDPLTQVADLVPRFRSIDQCRPFFVALLGNSGGPPLDLRQVESVIALMRAGIEPADEWIYGVADPSLVELEIRHGALNQPEAAGVALFYARTPATPAAGEPARSIGSDPKLDALKRGVQEAGFPLTGFESVETLGERLLDDLLQAIDRTSAARRGEATVDAPLPVPSPPAEVLETPEEGTADTLETLPVEVLATPEPVAPVPPAEPTSAQEATPISLDENVQFTVYRPRTVVPDRWYPMLAFAHLAERRPGEEREPDPIEEVKRQAAAVLGDAARAFQPVAQGSEHAVPCGGELTFVPEAEGVEFNPARRTFRWTERVHREEFRLRATPALDGFTARGRVSVFLGGILLADVAIAFSVDSVSGVHADPADAEMAHARPYRRIFASYSHSDLPIVEQYERYADALGDRYLRDWRELRAREEWSERLAELVKQADVFQLVWSSNSMHSPFVRREWEYALSLNRRNFVRPTYWEEPLPESSDGSLPPPSLRRLHFQRLTIEGSSGGGHAPPATTAAPASPGSRAPARSPMSDGRFAEDDTRPTVGLPEEGLASDSTGPSLATLLIVAAIALAALVGALWLWGG